MTRSFPEKTLEHWCSIHLGYRYKAQLQMWWPSTGEDISVASLPTAPGKRFWLELKTTEWVPKSGRHELTIDLPQLAAYARGAVPDYYVFPVPRWSGYLQSAGAWLGRLPASSLAYQTQSRLKWFAEWTFVVPGSSLRGLLAKEMKSGNQTKLLGSVSKGLLTWSPGLRSLKALKWKAFWELMERCGSSAFGAQFLVPLGSAPIGTIGTAPGAPNQPAGPGTVPVAPRPTRAYLARMLAGIQSESGDGVYTAQLEAFAPAADGVYQSVGMQMDSRDFDWIDPHRALVTMGVGALRFS